MSVSRTVSTARRALVCAASVTTLGTLAQAQIDWVSVHRNDSRLVSAPELGPADVMEKDYTWGDLNQDGWIDLVVVRKQPFMVQGHEPNVLFLNEGGVLVDHTGQYATASDVPGDLGFHTPTNDRDALFADVNGDGWLDVLTAATISPGRPKHESHPRVYINLGNDGNGDWLGLRFENDRIPDLGTFPNFCGMSAGDVTGDGFPDLYFAHYEQEADVDLDDRLFINDGTGFFTDESSTRMSAAMLESGFGTSAAIMDMNGDGVMDIVKNTGIGDTAATIPRIDVSYNDPSNEGFFNILQTAYNAQPYHVSVGDLNMDARPDLVASDDGLDRYVLNEGTDPLGRVIWSPFYKYDAAEDTFSTTSQIADLDGDGWNDVFIADMDIIFAGCSLRLHIYHNRGGTVGGFVDIEEEVGAPWLGVEGMRKADLKGSWDVAIFDIDNDGDNDMVIGRCEETNVWMNQAITPELGDAYCSPANANSTGSPAEIAATGSEFALDNDFTLTVTGLPPNQFGYFLASQTQGFVANPGGSQGNLCLGGSIARFVKDAMSSGPGGTFALEVDLTQIPPPAQTMVLPGDTWSFQAWYRDKNPTTTSNFTDGVAVGFR